MKGITAEFLESKKMMKFELDKEKGDEKEYEQFQFDMNGLRLKDLNRRNLRHIDQIKGKWER